MTIKIPADAQPIGSETAPEVVAAFTAATVTTFEELTSTHATLHEPVLVCRTPAIADVYACISLKRELPGRLACTFPLAVLESLVLRYLPAGTLLSTELINDTAGEFANVIAGQAKTMLKGTPYHYTLSTPVVSRESNPPADLERERRHLLFLFDIDIGTFGMQIVLPSCQ